MIPDLTQYSKLKVEIEHYLLHRLDEKFKGVIIRPSTVCRQKNLKEKDFSFTYITIFNK